MPSLKERVENNLAVFFLGALLVGFLSGVGAYEATLRISGRTTVALETLRSLEAKPSQPSQRFLVMHRVLGGQEEMVRVVARVNNLIYAYPADVAFTPIASDMPEQKLPLPIALDGYTLSFEAQVRDSRSGEIRQYKSRTTPQFRLDALPTDTQSYKLMYVTSVGDYGVRRSLTIEYSFR